MQRNDWVTYVSGKLTRVRILSLLYLNMCLCAESLKHVSQCHIHLLVVGEPCQVYHQNRRQLPNITLSCSLHRSFTVWAEPCIIRTQFLFFGKKVKTGKECDALRGFRAHCRGGGFNYGLSMRSKCIILTLICMCMSLIKASTLTTLHTLGTIIS